MSVPQLRTYLVLMVTCLPLAAAQNKAAENKVAGRTVLDDASFADWLGPQENTQPTSLASFVVGKPIDPARHDKLPRYDISLQIVEGRNLRLAKSDNPLVTFDGIAFQQTREFPSEDDAWYLVGKMQLKPEQRGWRFYTLNVRITEGPLRDAVVHLRDGKVQKSITGACIAVYRIPDQFKVKAGRVPLEVVALFAK